MADSGEHSITLPADYASVKKARDFVKEMVAGHVDDPAEVLLMTSELVSNVVGHVGSEVAITVREGPVVRIEVHNHEAATAAFRDLVHNSPRPADASPSGRGLGLVRSLASKVGLDDDADGGKVVWFEWERPVRDDDGDAAIVADGVPVPTP
jgi:anti-sigma regulatory factor (Ser/Thr protein kinase)